MYWFQIFWVASTIWVQPSPWTFSIFSYPSDLASLRTQKALCLSPAREAREDLVKFSERISLVAQIVKSLPAMQETWVLSLGQEDLLEKEMATHYSILAWRIPWTEEPGEPQSMGLQSRTLISCCSLNPLTTLYYNPHSSFPNISSLLKKRLLWLQNPLEINFCVTLLFSPSYFETFIISLKS